MTTGPAEAEGAPDATTLYDRLAAATPAERTEIVLVLLDDAPVRLPPRGEQGAVLDGILLGRATLVARLTGSPTAPSWWDAERRSVRLAGADLRGARLRGADLRGADLRGADLSGASLGEAKLNQALLEGAKLVEADLAGASLRGTGLGAAELQGALLEEADLRGASLRFTHLEGAALENADLRRADLWGAHLAGADAAGADFRGALLRESDFHGADLTRANLRGADLIAADLRGANLQGADLRGAKLAGAKLADAVLRDARLQGVDLSQCDVAHIHVSGAWLERTRLSPAQIGEAIGEERVGDFEGARKGYLALERTFEDFGDPDAASWAYRKKRRMQKAEALRLARLAWSRRDWPTALSQSANFVSDQLVEWLCDYGESIPRVLGSMVLVFLVFTAIYGLTGSVVRVVETPTGPVRTPTYKLPDLAVFSLLAMTTSGAPAVGLAPRSEFVHLLTGLQALLGIALTGLLGFVLGNLVRR